MPSGSTIQFTDALPLVERFTDALPRENYVTVPDDWYLAVTDVVGSRKAIAAGRYKAVNMAGVSMLSAIMNALGHQQMPYIFGGDGAAILFAPEDLDAAETALAATSRWVEDDLDLQLRAAIVPVSAIRKDGHDVLVAAVRISDAMRNYAFLGGGVDHAEKLMKEGKFSVERAAPGSRPDLTGLSCRWSPIEEKGSKIVSLIVIPSEGKSELPPKVIAELMSMVRADQSDASPVPKRGPGTTWPPEGLPLEEKASGMSKTALYAITLLAWILDKTGIPLGKFKPKHYREVTGLNTDYRKIQDGIRMTVCLPEERSNALRKLLESARSAGELRFGMFEQDKAVLTCFVPSIMEDNHMHFLDGAGGGYAAAADELA